MTELEFAEKYDYEGGGVGALLDYGLSARDLDVKAGALYEAVKRFDDEYRMPLRNILAEIDGLVGDVLEDLL